MPRSLALYLVTTLSTVVLNNTGQKIALQGNLSTDQVTISCDLKGNTVIAKPDGQQIQVRQAKDGKTETVIQADQKQAKTNVFDRNGVALKLGNKPVSKTEVEQKQKQAQQRQSKTLSMLDNAEKQAQALLNNHKKENGGFFGTLSGASKMTQTYEEDLKALQQIKADFKAGKISQDEALQRFKKQTTTNQQKAQESAKQWQKSAQKAANTAAITMEGAAIGSTILASRGGPLATGAVSGFWSVVRQTAYNKGDFSKVNAGQVMLDTAFGAITGKTGIGSTVTGTLVRETGSDFVLGAGQSGVQSTYNQLRQNNGNWSKVDWGKVAQDSGKGGIFSAVLGRGIRTGANKLAGKPLVETSSGKPPTPKTPPEAGSGKPPETPPPPEAITTQGKTTSTPETPPGALDSSPTGTPVQAPKAKLRTHQQQTEALEAFQAKYPTLKEINAITSLEEAADQLALLQQAKGAWRQQPLAVREQILALKRQTQELALQRMQGLGTITPQNLEAAEQALAHISDRSRLAPTQKAWVQKVEAQIKTVKTATLTTQVEQRAQALLKMDANQPGSLGEVAEQVAELRTLREQLEAVSPGAFAKTMGQKGMAQVQKLEAMLPELAQKRFGEIAQQVKISPSGDIDLSAVTKGVQSGEITLQELRILLQSVDPETLVQKHGPQGLQVFQALNRQVNHLQVTQLVAQDPVIQQWGIQPEEYASLDSLEEALKKRFRELARQNHSDLNPGQGDEGMKALNAQYEHVQQQMTQLRAIQGDIQAEGLDRLANFIPKADLEAETQRILDINRQKLAAGELKPESRLSLEQARERAIQNLYPKVQKQARFAQHEEILLQRQQDYNAFQAEQKALIPAPQPVVPINAQARMEINGLRAEMSGKLKLFGGSGIQENDLANHFQDIQAKARMLRELHGADAVNQALGPDVSKALQQVEALQAAANFRRFRSVTPQNVDEARQLLDQLDSLPPEAVQDLQQSARQLLDNKMLRASFRQQVEEAERLRRYQWDLARKAGGSTPETPPPVTQATPEAPPPPPVTTPEPPPVTSQSTPAPVPVAPPESPPGSFWSTASPEDIAARVNARPAAAGDITFQDAMAMSEEQIKAVFGERGFFRGFKPARNMVSPEVFEAIDLREQFLRAGGSLKEIAKVQRLVGKSNALPPEIKQGFLEEIQAKYTQLGGS